MSSFTVKLTTAQTPVTDIYRQTWGTGVTEILLRDGALCGPVDLVPLPPTDCIIDSYFVRNWHCGTKAAAAISL